MKYLILGSEGYIGTALAKSLLRQGHEVKGIDNMLRRFNVEQVGSASLFERVSATQEGMELLHIDISNEYKKLCAVLASYQPDTIVHLAEQPSAPFSMRGADEANRTMRNNIGGTLNVLWAMKEYSPDAHLVKLGTEGEYPDWIWDGKHIPEGNRLTVKYQGEDWEIPTPRYAGSWYHFSKVDDSAHIDYACKIWGLRATDINQGIVYGHLNETRFDYDETFGTVINRFVVQAVLGKPLTIYGTGGQTRGFIALQNSIEAIQLLSETPAERGQFRVIHQTTEARRIKEIADMVGEVAGCMVYDHVKNPRVEMAENEFTFDTQTLDNLGLKPVPMREVIAELYEKVSAHKKGIKKSVIDPKTKWV